MANKRRRRCPEHVRVLFAPLALQTVDTTIFSFLIPSPIWRTTFLIMLTENDSTASLSRS